MNKELKATYEEAMEDLTFIKLFKEENGNPPGPNSEPVDKAIFIAIYSGYMLLLNSQAQTKEAE